MAIVTWKNAVSGEWTLASNWSDEAVPASTDDVVIALPGSYLVTVPQGQSASANSLTISGGATVDGGGTLVSSGPVLNQGVLLADVASDFFQVNTTTLTNQGLMRASGAGAALFLASQHFSNLSGGVLTGGSYEVDGPAFGSFALLELYDTSGGSSVITGLNAPLTLNGGATDVFMHALASNFESLEATLMSIGTAGVLNLLAGRDYISGNALANDGVLRLGGGTLQTASLTTTAQGRIVGFGDIATPLVNAGTLEAQGGTLALHGISGPGAVVVDSGAVIAARGGLLTLGVVAGGGNLLIAGGPGAGTLELTASSSAGVAFQGSGGALTLDSPGSFTGSIVGFGIDETIDLAGVSASSAVWSNGTLTLIDNAAPVAHLLVAGDYSGASFQTQDDGAGGTAVTLAGVEYSLEGPSWSSRLISWSFAASNLDGDGAVPFSSFVDPATQAQEVAVVQSAFDRWAGIAGLEFVFQPTDSAAVDIRVGWGSLLGADTGEIGQANFNFDNAGNMQADAIVRLQDPAITALVADAGVIGRLKYSGLNSTLYQVALHEIGHDLGLGHSSDGAAVMNPTAQGVVNQDADASDIVGINALYASVACFAAGTRIATARGEVTVEALRIGDAVAGLVGRAWRRVRWTGHRRLDPSRHARPHDVQPIRVHAGAFGPDMPRRELRLSPDHAVFFNGALIPIRYLVNGATVMQEQVQDVTYFHVELEDADGRMVHDVLIAEGLPAESFLDTGNRSAFVDGDAEITLHPDFARRAWAESGCARLHVDGPAIVAARRHLLARATALGHRLTTDPAFEIVVDSPLAGGQAKQAGGIAASGSRRYIVPAEPLRLRSRTAVPAEAGDSDTRRLGVAVEFLRLNGMPITLDDPRLGAGFLPIEREGTRSWRWTDGNAELRIDAPGVLEITLAFTLSYWTEQPYAGSSSWRKGENSASASM